MSKRKVLIAPLDWGLGHATRCIPIIRLLLEANCEVMLAGSGSSLKMLQLEFPDLPYVNLPGYDPRYPRKGSMMATLMTQAFHFVKTVRTEHRITERIVSQHQINFIISDNRYGCYSKEIPCAFITHQLNLLAPAAWRWLGSMANFVTRYFRQQFSVCWVPDWPDSRLTGKMSATTEKDVCFIGPLSRFTFVAGREISHSIDVLVSLSGPEPQRTLFEEIILSQLRKTGKRAMVVRGIPGTSEVVTDGSIQRVNHLKHHEMEALIASAPLVICRSGYSTVMDLMVMRKKAVFVPTPGQTEQEYLADRLMRAGIAYSMEQKNFDLVVAMEASGKYKGFDEEVTGNELLSRHLREFINQQKP